SVMRRVPSNMRLTPALTKVSLCFALLAGSSLLQAQQNRIGPDSGRGRRVIMAGQVHPRVAVSQDQGKVAASLTISNITAAVAPPAEQQAPLAALLAAQQPPGSPEYRRWLTPEQYAERFGLGDSDLSTVRAWLESEGLTVTATARSRSWIAVSGAADRVEAAFQTEIHRYLDNGEAHIANATA